MVSGCKRGLSQEIVGSRSGRVKLASPERGPRERGLWRRQHYYQAAPTVVLVLSCTLGTAPKVSTSSKQEVEVVEV